jgi:DNA-binding MarR family transcriptional regulator
METIVQDAPEGHKVELRLWLRLLSTVNLISREIRRRLRAECGLTLPQFDLLAQLDRTEDGVRLGELSQRMMVTNGNITGLIARLEADGLIAREVAGNDRRVAVARLTATGRTRFRAFAAAHETWLAEMLADLDGEARAALLERLAVLKASVRAHASTNGGVPGASPAA